MKKVLLAALAVVMMAGASFAATPIQLSLWDKLALPPSDEVYGLEIGIGNNLSEIKGIQWNFIWSETSNGIGWQAGFLTRVTGEFTGLKTGFINWNEGTVKGVEFGFVNIDKNFTGLAVGAVNYAENLTGVQLGFFNYAKSATDFAIQIGLVNYLGNSLIYEWFPFINVKF